jgi:hypothetical protein
MHQGEVLMDGPDSDATSRQDRRRAGRQPADDQAHVKRPLRRSTVWLRHVQKPHDGTSGRAPISNRTRAHDRGSAGRRNRSGAPTGDVAAIRPVAPVGGTADATSRPEASSDPIVMLLELLFFPSKLAWSATASMAQLPLWMIAGPADGHPGPSPGESTGAHPETADAREPAAGPPFSADATSAGPRSVGDDDRGSRSTAHNLAHILRSGGDYESARCLDEDILARRRRVLGDDHPDTLSSAHNLAIDLSAMGEHEAARTLAEDTLARRRSVVGDDHPDTLSSAHDLALRRSADGGHAAASSTTSRPGSTRLQEH